MQLKIIHRRARIMAYCDLGLFWIYLLVINKFKSTALSVVRNFVGNVFNNVFSIRVNKLMARSNELLINFKSSETESILLPGNAACCCTLKLPQALWPYASPLAALQV